MPSDFKFDKNSNNETVVLGDDGKEYQLYNVKCYNPLTKEFLPKVLVLAKATEYLEPGAVVKFSDNECTLVEGCDKFERMGIVDPFGNGGWEVVVLVDPVLLDGAMTHQFEIHEPGSYPYGHPKYDCGCGPGKT